MPHETLLEICDYGNAYGPSRLDWLSAILNAVQCHLQGDTDAFTEDAQAINTALSEAQDLYSRLKLKCQEIAGE